METDFTQAAEHDKLAETINYELLYNFIEEILTGEAFHLIETVAKRIADRVLDSFPTVTGVVVRVRKPGAPVKGVIDYVEAEVDERR